MFSIYAKIAAALALIAALAGIYWKIHHDGVVSGRAEIQADWDADKNSRKIAEEKAIADRLRANELRVKQNEDEKAKLKEYYETKLAKLSADSVAARASGLRVPAAVLCSGFANRPETAGPGITNDPRATIELPPATQRRLFDIADEANKCSEQLSALQRWVFENGMAP